MEIYIILKRVKVSRGKYSDSNNGWTFMCDPNYIDENVVFINAV